MGASRHKETLKAALDKAIENGYDFQASHNRHKEQCFWFTHDFGKAFWADGRVLLNGSPTASHPAQAEWKKNLQQMVLEEDPLRYRAKFL